MPRACPNCGSVDLTRIGSGTRGVEDELAERYPALEILRLDADVAARPGEPEATLTRFRESSGRCWWARSLSPRGTTCPG